MGLHVHKSALSLLLCTCVIAPSPHINNWTRLHVIFVLVCDCEPTNQLPTIALRRKVGQYQISSHQIQHQNQVLQNVLEMNLRHLYPVSARPCVRKNSLAKNRWYQSHLCSGVNGLRALHLKWRDRW